MSTTALSAASRACTDAIAAIGHGDPDSAPLTVVLADIDAHLAAIYDIATKIAIALKPPAPAPAYDAAVPLLADVALHPPAIARAIGLLHDDLHGATLVKDVSNRAKEIIDALHALLQTFLGNDTSQVYLVRTAALHDLIADARSPSGIPIDNQTAVYRAWKADKESLEDNLEELTTMIQRATSDDPSDQIDDGWDDVGLAHSSRMDEHELARANNVYRLLRLTTLLHKRICLDLLAHPSSAPVSTLDALLAQSNLLLSTSDDLVAALYTPHDPAYIRAQIRQLANIATSLHTHLTVFLVPTDDLADQLRTLSVGDSAPKKKATKKWFDTCVDQIRRLSSTASESPKA